MAVKGRLPTTAADSLLSVQQAAELLGVSQATVRNWAKTGLVRAQKPGRAIAFSKAEVCALRDKIARGRQGRLQSRRNKNSIGGTVMPLAYAASADYRRCAEAAAGLAEKLRALHGCGSLAAELILAELGARLLVEAHQGQELRGGELYLDQVRAGAGPPGAGRLLASLVPVDRDICAAERDILRAVGGLRFEFCAEDDLLGFIYMSLSNLGRRKKAGSYYTPSPIAARLAALCLGCKNKAPLRIIDPCCGSGNFLLKLFFELKKGYLAAGAGEAEASRRAAAGLHGCDLDHTAVALARLNLSLAAGAGCDYSSVAGRIKVRDSLTCSWPGPDFDLVIGNPPWGYAFTDSQLAALSARYETARGRESFALFIELALRLLRPGGAMAYVLPQAFLNVELHQDVRKLLLETARLEWAEFLDDAFDGVFAPALLLRAVKGKARPEHKMTVVSGRGVHRIGQARFAQNDLTQFNLGCTDGEQAILEKMKRVPGVMYLRGSAKFALGIVTGDNRRFIKDQDQPGAEAVLKGSDIFKYNYAEPQSRILFTPEKFQQVAPLKYYRAPEKLIYRFINKQLVFAYDDRQMLSLNSANVLIPELTGYRIKYAAAVLNSSFAQFFFQMSYASVKVLRRHLESIPIPACPLETQTAIISLVDLILQETRGERRRQLYAAIDGHLGPLYNLTGREIRQIYAQVGSEPLFPP